MEYNRSGDQRVFDYCRSCQNPILLPDPILTARAKLASRHGIRRASESVLHFFESVLAKKVRTDPAPAVIDPLPDMVVEACSAELSALEISSCIHRLELFSLDWLAFSPLLPPGRSMSAQLHATLPQTSQRIKFRWRAMARGKANPRLAFTIRCTQKCFSFAMARSRWRWSPATCGRLLPCSSSRLFKKRPMWA